MIRAMNGAAEIGRSREGARIEIRVKRCLVDGADGRSREGARIEIAGLCKLSVTACRRSREGARIEIPQHIR